MLAGVALGSKDQVQLLLMNGGGQAPVILPGDDFTSYHSLCSLTFCMSPFEESSKNMPLAGRERRHRS